MIPAQDLIPGALAAVLRKAPLTPEKVAFAWRMAVGPAIDGATTIDLRESVLHVHVTSASWKREVERSAKVIRARLDGVLGKGVVNSIRVETG